MNSTRSVLLNNFYKTLFSIAVPIILQNLLQTFVNMVDTIMVGQLGAVSIAAVGLGNQIFFMLNMVVFGITSGCSVFISQFWGAQDLKQIRKSFGIMLTVCLAASLAFMAGGLFIPQKLLGLYSTDLAVITEGSRYLKVAALCYPIFAIATSCQMAFRSTEHVILPMVTTTVSFVLNITLNALLIFGFEPLGIPAFGVVGAAIATAVSRLAEALITVIVGIINKYEVFGPFAQMFCFEKAFIKKLVVVAIPVLLSESCWGLGITTQNSIFAHSGTDSFAAYSIMNTVSQLTWVFFIGMGSASSVILGKKIGAGEEEAARAYTTRFAWFFPVMGGLIGLFLFPLSRILPFIFNVSPQIIKIAQTMLYVLMALYPLRAFNMLIIVGVCRSGGDTLYGSIIDNGWVWLLAIPLGVAATFVWHCPAWLIMLCLESEQLFKAVCGMARIKSGKWLHNVTKK